MSCSEASVLRLKLIQCLYLYSIWAKAANNIRRKMNGTGWVINSGNDVIWWEDDEQSRIGGILHKASCNRADIDCERLMTSVTGSDSSLSTSNDSSCIMYGACSPQTGANVFVEFSKRLFLHVKDKQNRMLGKVYDHLFFVKAPSCEYIKAQRD